MQGEFDFSRRQFLETASGAGLAMAGGLLVPAGLSVSGRANAQTVSRKADHTIRIAPVSHEIAPGKFMEATAYNGLLPGPPLRLRSGLL